MPSNTLDDAISRLDRALAGVEAAITEREAALRSHIARKDASVREAMEELDALIATLNGGHNG